MYVRIPLTQNNHPIILDEKPKIISEEDENWIAELNTLSKISYSDFNKKINDFYTTFPTKKLKKEINSFDDLLNGSFFTAESHYDLAPKMVLIKNMLTLKKAGFDTFFLEGFYFSKQYLLDEYFSSTDEMRSTLSYELDSLNEANKFDTSLNTVMFPMFGNEKKFKKKYNYKNLVKKAKEVGIRVVGLEVPCPDTKNGRFNPKYRVASFNYTAFQIIQHETCGKWFGLIGAAHSITYEGVPSLSSLLDAEVFRVSDSNQFFNRTYQLKFNSSNTTKPDVELQVPKYKNPPLFTLPPAESSIENDENDRAPQSEPLSFILS